MGWRCGGFFGELTAGLKSQNDNKTREMIDKTREMNDKCFRLIDNCLEMIDIFQEMIDNYPTDSEKSRIYITFPNAILLFRYLL